MPELRSDTRGTDRLYAKRRPTQDFRFSAEVARVFDDMATRSVPGYASLIHGIGVLGARHMHPSFACYDLGCSLGAVARSWASLDHDNIEIIGIDSSPDMIAQAQEISEASIQYRCADIREVEFRPSGVIALNLTLQFLPVADRKTLLQNIAHALHENGALILTEKVCFDEPEEARINRQYEGFKRLQGYSELEISQKRTALERTLIRDSIETHLARLQEVGFQSTIIWFQCLHFYSVLARLNNAPIF